MCRGAPTGCSGAGLVVADLVQAADRILITGQALTTAKGISANMKKYLRLLAATVLVAGCAADLPPIVGCEPVADIRPVCDMQTPEDIAAVPDGRHLLLAHFSGMETGTGSLSLFDTQTEQLRTLFPPQESVLNYDGAEWGQADCPAPDWEIFRPHGTHLRQLADGRWRYLVVNHGGRESVEMFELTLAGGDSSLSWRGCVLAAQDTRMNDVVGLSNGDLIFSRMLSTGGNIEFFLSTLGVDSGDLWRWNKETGLRILPGTEAAQPNGLEISADERFVFANMYFEKEIWKVDVDSGETVAVGEVAYVDNSAWGTDGRLWLVSHTGSPMEMLSCLNHQAQTCGASFEIVAMDPGTMQTELVFSHSGPPMGAATVAVPQGNRVYMGSFVGDRMISVPNFSP